jgi:phosphopantetheinyl transferase
MLPLLLTMPHHSVHIRLLNISDQEGDEASRSEHLHRLLDDLVGSCYEARDVLRISKELVPAATLRKEITRFVKINDRFLAVASVLLKSRAFFETFPWMMIPKQHTLALLPRTKHRKPYIPVHSNAATQDDEEGSEVNVFSISLSHQWPFIGLARIEYGLEKKDLPLDSEKHLEGRSPILVGFDLVVFEEVNRRLYASVEEFVTVFQEVFTVTEWTQIHSWKEEESGYLREFYLQWAVKEAYTKALGVGLGFDFASFQVEWDGATTSGLSLWKTVSSFPAKDNGKGQQENIIELRGTVILVGKNGERLRNQRPEHWVFAFLPVRATGAGIVGAACACLGPFPVTASVDIGPVNWNVEWTDLAKMLPTGKH